MCKIHETKGKHCSLYVILLSYSLNQKSKPTTKVLYKTRLEHHLERLSVNIGTNVIHLISTIVAVLLCGQYGGIICTACLSATTKSNGILWK